MSPSKKRKTSPIADEVEPEPSKRRNVNQDEQDTPETDQPEAPSETPVSPAKDDKQKERMERFKALKARQTQSRKQNLKDSADETKRLATNPALLQALSRKHDKASAKLLRAETAEAGEDFERRRAWDWTAEESEKWDRQMEKKERHRGERAFQDYRHAAEKAYKRELTHLTPDVEGYQREKMAAVERAAKRGGLEILETEEGELIAVDKDGSFYSTADSTAFVHNKPGREAVDRLVEDLKNAEAVRMKKRRDRYKDEEDTGDVTYINLQNKQFNEKLSRFYDKYTTDIRESFERGTAM
ncbi:SYF2-domain-containing protein [Eremomyces bilateralis CBS 781.70]|uniref:Pre-mRNA-splicing factor SYF2 n=1 Tax=Eremomyces bilateralis CBS 781.70 TaxID=1392243 RepID=A0A6G1GFG1_9PEZI|nr:SYF2-domain-containing protein [Eremomyces bilateralis CBS 781.70]KAF1816656.1 SYF2-domain-containing protein [Eremomyces bilateralis CBS 781.70]